MPDTAPISDLPDHLGFWLRQVSNHVSHNFAMKLSGRGVTVAEWVILRALYGRHALAPSALAEEIGLTRGAISKLADRLIAKNLVERKPDLKDRRAQTLALSKAGAALVPDLSTLADRNDAEFFAHLSPEERSQLEGMLRRMVQQFQMTGMPVE